MIFTKSTLGEIINKYGGVIQTGPFGSQLHQSDYQDYGVPVVMPKDIIDDQIDTTSIARVDDVIVRKLSRHILEECDIVYPRRGNLNKRAYINNDQVGWLCGTGCIKIRVAERPLDSKYFFYFLKHPPIVKFIENKAIGATMPNLNSSVLADIPIHYPDYHKQKTIAAILFTYDEMIVNNNRRMELLEETMRLLYREWFVNLRFPGYERVKIVDGVPYGWEKVQIGELFEFHIGGGWGKEMPDSKHTEPAYVIRGTDINNVKQGNYDKVPFRYHKESNLRSRKLRDKDLIFEVSGGSKTQGVGRSLLVNQQILDEFDYDVMCASFCKLLRLARQELAEYFALLIDCLRENNGLVPFESQSASNIINFKFMIFLEHQMILVPTIRVIDELNSIVFPMSEQVTNLSLQNNRLRKARDVLLPRLMNGSTPV